MATVEKRGKSWRVAWRYGGNRTGNRESSTWPDERLARQAKAIAEARGHRITAAEVDELILGPAEPAASTLPTVTEWADTWLAARTRITPRVRHDYRRQLDTRILPAIGNLHLDEVTGVHVAAFLNSLRAAGLSDATATRYYSVLHGMFGFAVREGHIKDNPARRTDFVRDLVSHADAGDNEKVFLTPQELDLIVANASPVAVPLLRALAYTGARWSEMTAVAVGSVDLFAKPPTMRIIRAWKRAEDGSYYLGATKSGRRRTVALSQSLVDVLIPLVADRKSEALLFTSPGGSRWDGSHFHRLYWKPAVVAAMRCPNHPPVPEPGRTSVPADAVSTCDCPTRLRKRPTVHSLRHTHAAWLISAGVPLPAIQRRLGHEQITTTIDTYGHLLPDVETATIAALDAATGGKAKPTSKSTPGRVLTLRRGRARRG